MNKKYFIFSIIFILAFCFISFTYGSDIIMDLNNSSNTNTSNVATSNNTNSINTNTNTNSDNSTVDNTIYSPDIDVTSTSSDIQEPITTATTDYDESGDLTIGNMINIVLIVVGIVLILLGIAIIIRLK